MSHDVVGHRSPALADLDLDEGGLDNPGSHAATTDVDENLVTLLGRRAEQRQRDSLLQGWGERARGDLTQPRAISCLDLTVRTRDTATGGQQTPGDPLRSRGLLCGECILAPECVLPPAHGPAGTRLHRGDVQAQ